MLLVRVPHLLEIKVSEGGGRLILPLLVEDHLETASVVAEFQHCAHGLIVLRDKASDYDNLAARAKKC